VTAPDAGRSEAAATVNGGAEAYCVDSGMPVRWEAGDRCKAHGNRLEPCFAAQRHPRCEHPDWPRFANGSDKCPECGERVQS
jgi:hypothetical protein